MAAGTIELTGATMGMRLGPYVRTQAGEAEVQRLDC
jgi:hypothetical protein